MSERDDLTKLVVTLIATTGPIWRNQPVNACPDDDPVGEPRPMRAVPVNDVTGFINGLLEFLTAHDEQVRADERERCWDEGKVAEKVASHARSAWRLSDTSDPKPIARNPYRVPAEQKESKNNDDR